MSASPNNQPATGNKLLNSSRDAKVTAPQSAGGSRDTAVGNSSLSALAGKSPCPSYVKKSEQETTQMLKVPDKVSSYLVGNAHDVALKIFGGDKEEFQKLCVDRYRNLPSKFTDDESSLWLLVYSEFAVELRSCEKSNSTTLSGVSTKVDETVTDQTATGEGMGGSSPESAKEKAERLVNLLAPALSIEIEAVHTEVLADYTEVQAHYTEHSEEMTPEIDNILKKIGKELAAIEEDLAEMNKCESMETFLNMYVINAEDLEKCKKNMKLINRLAKF